MTLLGTEFLRRFFLHVLPKGFVRIRYFGFLANRFRAQCLSLCQQLLASDRPAPPRASEAPANWHCPHCGAAMVPQTHCGGTIAVRLLRYLLMLRTTADHRRARRTPADLCACPSPNHLAAFRASASSNFSAIATAFGDLTPPFGFVLALTSAGGSSKAAFISHSQRPPQTPAASF
jgi:hypothetical protein